MSGAARQNRVRVPGLLSREWLEFGFFDLDSRALGSRTFTLRVRDQLASSLGERVECVGYPQRARFRRSFYWRTGTIEYREAQFMASLDRDHAVLSVGLSVEKGLEIDGVDPNKRLDRRTWDWAALMKKLDGFIGKAVPKLCREIERPVSLWVAVDREGLRGQSRTYVCDDNGWIQRREGRVQDNAIIEQLRAVDSIKDAWINLRVGYDLFPSDVGAAAGMPATEFAGRLLQFDGLRRYIRKT